MNFEKVTAILLAIEKGADSYGCFRRPHWPHGRWIQYIPNFYPDTFHGVICVCDGDDGSYDFDEWMPTDEDKTATDWVRGKYREE